jgi:carbonic anhydrase
MSLIDDAMKANEQFARGYDLKLGGRPQPKIAVATCMDPRLSDLEGMLRLKTAGMDVIRTVARRSPTTCWENLSFPPRSSAARCSCSSITRAVGSQPSLKEPNDKISRETGDATPVPMRSFSFKDPERADRESSVASMDRQGCARSRLHFRCGHGSVAGSQAWMIGAP